MADNFKDLLVWQKSRDLTKEIYILCKSLPKEEVFGLCSQIQRAAVSVPSNIAEGYRRKSSKEFLQFLSIASGSCAEVETQLILIEDIFDIDTKELQAESIQIQKMLSSLVTKVKQRSN